MSKFELELKVTKFPLPLISMPELTPEESLLRVVEFMLIRSGPDVSRHMNASCFPLLLSTISVPLTDFPLRLLDVLTNAIDFPSSLMTASLTLPSPTAVADLLIKVVLVVVVASRSHR